MEIEAAQCGSMPIYNLTFTLGFVGTCRERSCTRVSQNGGTQSLERQHIERKRVCIDAQQIERAVTIVISRVSHSASSGGGIERPSSHRYESEASGANVERKGSEVMVRPAA